MIWWATETLTAELPDSSGLRAAAYTLHSAGDALATQASVTSSVVAVIVPGVWQDDSSGRAKTILQELSGELSSGSSAMYQAAGALDSLASYVDGQRWRYSETGQRLEELASDPVATIAHHELGEAEQLIDERRSIEQAVSAAMGYAAEIIDQATAKATRYHGGQSFWSSIEQDAVASFKSVWRTDSDFLSGVWDGTYAMGKSTVEIAWSLAVLGAKLNPERMLVDPVGWMRDYEHAVTTFATTVDDIAHNKKAFVENLVNLQELKSNPAHWFGELAPQIAVVLLTTGAGAAAKGADAISATETIDATAEAGTDASAAARLAGKVATGGAFSSELAGMSEADRLTYLREIVQLTKSEVPSISQKEVDDTIVKFEGNANFSFSAEQLDHDTIGNWRTDQAGNQVFDPKSGNAIYDGGHHFPGFGGKPDFPADWNVLKMVKNSYKVLADPDSDWHYNTNGRPGFKVDGQADGFKMTVIVNPQGKGIITSFPDDPTWVP